MGSGQWAVGSGQWAVNTKIALLLFETFETTQNT